MRNLLAAGIAALFCPALAHAQSSEELVITATRTPARANALPSRIDVIERAEIERAAITTLSAALGPESVQAGGAGQQASLFLRGANSKHVLALLDGVRLNDPSTPNAVYDFGQDTLGAVDRIEIIRGPASSIYGSDAIGGAVNIIPRRGGPETFAPFLEASLGSLDTRHALAGAAGSTGALEYGVSGEWFDTAGYDVLPERMRTERGVADGASVSTATASLRHAGPRVVFDALLRWRKSEAAYDTFSGGAFFDRRADDPDLGANAAQTLWRLGAEAGSQNESSLRLAVGEVRTERSEHDNGAATNEARANRRFFEALLRRDRGDHSFTLGLAYERDDIAVSGPFSNPLSADEARLGVYAIGQASFAGLTATASARADAIDGFGVQPSYALGVVREAGAWRAFASIGRAFKAPSLGERFETSFFNVGNPDLAPEVSDSWEIGADWRSARARAGASYYQTRIQELIEYDFPARRNLNVGRADIDGVEAYVALAIAPGNTVRIDYAWTDARNADNGMRLLRRPEHRWGGQAEFALSERVTLLADWRRVGARGDVTYDNGGAFVSANGVVAAYDVLALSAAYALFSEATLFARADNLADESYEQPAAFAGPPRSFSIGLRARR